jgi:hypothetical protein
LLEVVVEVVLLDITQIIWVKDLVAVVLVD